MDQTVDILVSTNTLSHIPIDFHPQSLKKHDWDDQRWGNAYINTPTGKEAYMAANILARSFKTVEPVYTSSFLPGARSYSPAEDIEEDVMIESEQNLPNDSSLHEAVLFICTEKVIDCPLPHSKIADFRRKIEAIARSNKLETVNEISFVTRQTFADDLSLIRYLKQEYKEGDVVAAPRYFLSTDYFRSELQAELGRESIDMVSVEELRSVDIARDNCSLYLFGLEHSWDGEDSRELRYCINDFRYRFNEVRVRSLISRSRRGAVIHSTDLARFG